MCEDRAAQSGSTVLTQNTVSLRRKVPDPTANRVIAADQMIRNLSMKIGEARRPTMLFRPAM